MAAANTISKFLTVQPQFSLDINSNEGFIPLFNIQTDPNGGDGRNATQIQVNSFSFNALVTPREAAVAPDDIKPRIGIVLLHASQWNAAVSLPPKASDIFEVTNTIPGSPQVTEINKFGKLITGLTNFSVVFSGFLSAENTSNEIAVASNLTNNTISYPIGAQSQSPPLANNYFLFVYDTNTYGENQIPQGGSPSNVYINYTYNFTNIV